MLKHLLRLLNIAVLWGTLSSGVSCAARLNAQVHDHA